MRTRHSLIDLFLLAILVIPASILIYVSSYKVEEFIQERVISDTISIVDHTIGNISKKILNEIGGKDIVMVLSQDDKLRREVEDYLSFLVNPEIKYVYIVYRDKEGKFRFLADGSKEDKGRPGEKLDVFNEEKWKEAVEEAKNVIIIQRNLYTIGATYLKPFVQNGKVRALFVVDFSVRKIRNIQGTLNLIKYLSTGTSVASILFLTLALYQYIRRKRIERALYRDPLTGLLNRSYLEAESFRIDTTYYYIALIDIDDFRKVNTTHGESFGDIVLRQFAEYLGKKLPQGSVLIRYAGEEFLIFVPKIKFADKWDIVSLLEGIKEDIKSNPFGTEETKVRLRVSVGLNISTERSRSIDEAIRGADRALYRAKREGKDKVEIYDRSIEELKKSISVEKVRDAIESGRLICYYQPIVDLETGEVSHYEALARIVDPEHDIYTPAYFLEDIKDTFLYTKFMKEIININSRLLEERKDLNVSINMFPTDILDGDVIEVLERLDEDVRKRMFLEITEVEGIPSFERMKENLRRLRDLGFRICIDDFGAGYSNLINLTQLRIDCLKIDGSIIKDIHKNRISYLLTKMIAEFCKETGVYIVAEYVENEKILLKLRELGIRYGQGYHLGRPKPFEDINSCQSNKD